MLLFIHGGGWVTESIDNYERICARLANATGQYVVAVEYRLAGRSGRLLCRCENIIFRRFYAQHKTRKYYIDRR